eukprot:scaffold833_cov352-Pavlova_lutheri.AAC.19
MFKIGLIGIEELLEESYMCTGPSKAYVMDCKVAESTTQAQSDPSYDEEHVAKVNFTKQGRDCIPQS